MLNKVYNTIVTNIERPGQMVLGSKIAEELGIPEDSFWDYAKQLKGMGKIGMSMNYVHLR